MKKTVTCCMLLWAFSVGAALGQTASVTIDTGAEGDPLNPGMFGLFFEEINHSGDGGLYAEQIENRSFEDYRLPEGTVMRGDKAVGPNKGWGVEFSSEEKFPGWEFSARDVEAYLTLETENPIHKNNPSYACVTVGTAFPKGEAVLSNDGFWGIPITKGEQYKFSVFARAPEKTVVRVRLVGPENAVLGETTLEITSSAWTKYEAVFTGPATADARLELVFTKPGKVYLDEVSLFPPTFNDRPNGLRKDLVERFRALEPGFVRFPGGCVVEGCTVANRYQPTTTLGPTETRPSRWSLWGYRSNQGLGLHEYLQFCEDLNAEAMLVVSCGMACEFRDGGMAPLEELQPFIDDALNAIEYALGPVTSRYGAMRAAAGHPEPFNLRYVEIGNENWGKEYIPRYKAFHAALKAKYPDLIYVSCIEIPEADVDIRDDHFYSTPGKLAVLPDRYDSETRGKRKVYIGEFGVSQKVHNGNLNDALGEAAMMLGMERRADLITMASYAPRFHNVNDPSWSVQMIGFDNRRTFCQPIYYVQQMFATQKGDRVLPTAVSVSQPKDGTPAATLLFATWNTQAEIRDLTVTDAGGKEFRLAPNEEKALFAPLAQELPAPNIVVVPGLQLTGEYTFRFRARKLGGAEGLLIGLNCYDGQNYTWINRAGFENTKDAVIQRVNGERFFLDVKTAEFRPYETGVWYDYEIRVGRNSLAAFENGKLFLESAPAAGGNGFWKPLGSADQASKLFALAHRDTQTGDLLVRIVNRNAAPADVQIELKNWAGKTEFTVEETVLTSEKATDRNSLDEPEKIVPKTSAFRASGTAFTYKAAANSLTNLRLKPSGSGAGVSQ